jgi:hypothetical protein
MMSHDNPQGKALSLSAALLAVVAIGAFAYFTCPDLERKQDQVFKWRQQNFPAFLVEQWSRTGLLRGFEGKQRELQAEYLQHKAGLPTRARRRTSNATRR